MSGPVLVGPDGTPASGAGGPVRVVVVFDPRDGHFVLQCPADNLALVLFALHRAAHRVQGELDARDAARLLARGGG